MYYYSVIINVIKELSKVNLYATFLLNFKKLPLYQAYKLPILIYGKVKIIDLNGQIQIDCKEFKFGMIKIGGSHEIVVSSIEPTEILIKGKIIFSGNARFGKGIKMIVWKRGNIYFGNNFSIGTNSHIVSFRKINFGSNCLISWKCNFYDTDFHFMKNIITDEINDNCGEINIGNNTWIGSHVTILKNTSFPDEIIVGSNSLCSGNYLEKVDNKSIIAGNPAKLVKKNTVYIFNSNEEKINFNKYIN
jgi:acetyltransferase-like isoleucine patch superfamily enzyme